MSAPGILRSSPIVSLAVVRRLVRDEHTDELELEGEHPALVWDPTAMRAVLDEKPGREPAVAMIVPEEAR